MIEFNELEIDTSKQSFAHWAIKKPRHPLDVSALISSAIIRARPLVLVNVALLLCAVGGAGMFMVATYALGATT